MVFGEIWKTFWGIIPSGLLGLQSLTVAEEMETQGNQNAVIALSSPHLIIDVHIGKFD